MANAYFTSDVFEFLEDLTNNNDRDWFNANKDRFIEKVREPSLDFITDYARPLKAISPHFVADSRTVGGSLFRIQRDTRFSKDKTPYKTHVGIHFRHFATREDVHAPGYYLHIEPGESFAGLGLWRPATADAYAIRHKIADESTRWKRAVGSKRFTDIYTLEGDSLVRPPKSFDPEDPLIEDLKRKDFLGTARFKESEITADDFMDTYTQISKAGTPFMRFLCEAVRVPF
ncbi:MAG: DUF2461 domain-containing protein [Acidimicrobiia bacterium]